MKPTLDPALLLSPSYKHQTLQDTQFADMDILGHVNNLAVARFYESARARWQLAFLAGIFIDKITPLK